MVANYKSQWAQQHGTYTHLSSEETGQHVLHRMRILMPKLHEVVHDNYRMILPMLLPVEVTKELYFRFWMPYKNKATGHVNHESRFAKYMFLPDNKSRKTDPFRNLTALKVCKLLSVEGRKISSRDEFLGIIKALASKLPRDQATFPVETEWADYGYEFPPDSLHRIDITPVNYAFPCILNHKMCFVDLQPGVQLDSTVKRILASEKMILKSVQIFFANDSLVETTILSAESMDEVDHYLSTGHQGSFAKWLTLSFQVPANRSRLMKLSESDDDHAVAITAKEIHSALSRRSIHVERDNEREFSLWTNPVGKGIFSFVGEAKYTRIPFCWWKKSSDGIGLQSFHGCAQEAEIHTFECLRYRYLGPDFSNLRIIGSRSEAFADCDGIGFRPCDFIPYVVVTKVNDYYPTGNNEKWILQKLRSSGINRTLMEFEQQGWVPRAEVIVRIPILYTRPSDCVACRVTVDSRRPSPRIISIQRSDGESFTILDGGVVEAVRCCNPAADAPWIRCDDTFFKGYMHYVHDGFLILKVRNADAGAQKKHETPVEPLVSIVGEEQIDKDSHGDWSQYYYDRNHHYHKQKISVPETEDHEATQDDDLPDVSSDSSGEFHRRSERYDVQKTMFEHARHDRKQANRIWNPEKEQNVSEPLKRCIAGLRNMSCDVDGIYKDRVKALAQLVKSFGEDEMVISCVIAKLDNFASGYDTFPIRIRALRVSRLLQQVSSGSEATHINQQVSASSGHGAQDTDRRYRNDPRGYGEQSYYAPSSLVGSTNYDTRDRYGYDDKSYYAPSSYVGNTKRTSRDRRGYNSYRKNASSDESDTETCQKRCSPRRRRFTRSYSSSDEDTRDRRRNRASGSKY